MGHEYSSTRQNVKDIEAGGRHWLEQVLGRTLDDDEQVYIMAYRTIVPDEARRRAAHEDLMRILDEAHRNAEAQGITAEEADAAVEEAMDQIRHRKSS